MKEVGQDMAYENFGAELDAEAARRDADGKCWMVLDLNDGNVAVCAWFGTPEKMAALRDQLRALPQIECTCLWRNASADTIAAALNAHAEAGAAKPTKPTKAAKPKKTRSKRKAAR